MKIKKLRTFQDINVNNCNNYITESKLKNRMLDILGGTAPQKSLVYHLSSVNLDNTAVYPTIPKWLQSKEIQNKLNSGNNVHEDFTTPRVCFSKSITGCIAGMFPGEDDSFDYNALNGEKFYVHIPEKPLSHYKIKTNKELVNNNTVFDAFHTAEMWIIEPVKMICIGKIKIDKYLGDGKRYNESYFKWSWVEHYDQKLLSEDIFEDVSENEYWEQHDAHELLKKQKEPTVKSTSNINKLSDLYKLDTPNRLYNWMKSNISYKEFNRLMTPDEVFKNKTGSCHDQVLFEYSILSKMKIDPQILFFIAYKEGSTQGGMTHSLIYYNVGDAIYWFENAWNNARGIRKYKDLNYLKMDIFNRYRNEPDFKEFPELEFEDISISNFRPGMKLDEFIDNIMNDFASSDFVSRQEDEVEFNRDTLKTNKFKQHLISVNESTSKSNADINLWYHLVPKGTDMKDGIISPEWMITHGQYKLFHNSTYKYRNRMVDGWDIYPGRDPDDLTDIEVLDGLKKFRGSNGAKQIYLFKYPPTKELGPNMSKTLAGKDLYEVDLSKVKDIIDIDYGHEGSFTGNRKLTAKDYAISSNEYFKSYDDNTEGLLFATINHISVSTKSGRIDPSAIRKIDKISSIKSITNESSDKSVLDKSFEKKDKYKLSDYKMTVKNISSDGIKSDYIVWYDGDKKVCQVYADIDKASDGNIWFGSLEVFKDYKGRGLSEQVLDYIIKKYHSNILTVYKDNEVAIKAYKKVGFRIIKNPPHVPKEYFTMMRKPFANESIDDMYLCSSLFACIE